jgi:prepilin-type N-terminal cleavage/methylation domain-containing protein
LISKRSSTVSAAGGFTLPELLVVMLLAGLIAAGMGGVFSTQNRAYMQQDLHVAMGENLRVGMSTVTDTLRMAGCGVPPSHLGSWISWTSGFVDHPIVVTDGGSNPDTLMVAACTPPLATMITRSDAGSTTIILNPTIAGKSTGDLFNVSDKSLIWVGDGDYAKIRSVSGNVLTVDTDPTATGNQGLLRSHPLGAVVSRVDVHTFLVDTDPDAALPSLRVDRHHGTVTTAAEGISDLQLETITPGRQYRVTLTGRTERHDPVNGAFLTRALVSNITLRN